MNLEPAYQADLLSVCYTDKAMMRKVASFVPRESFTIPQCQWLYDLACHTMEKSGELPTAGLVAQEARSQYSGEEFNVVIQVHSDLIKGRESPDSIVQAAARFAEQSHYRDIALKHNRLIEQGKFYEAQQLMELQPWRKECQTTKIRSNFGYDDYERLMTNAKNRRDDPSIFKHSTGIHDLDVLMGGGYPLGDMLTLIGWTGRGKSTLAINLAHMNMVNGHAGVYISSEMRDELITSKFFARYAAVDQNTIHEYGFTTDEAKLFDSFMIDARQKMRRKLLVVHLGIYTTTHSGILTALDQGEKELDNMSWCVIDTIDHCRPSDQFKRDKVAGFADNMNWANGEFEDRNISGIVTTQSNRGGAQRTEMENAANTIEGARVSQWVIAVNGNGKDAVNTRPDPGESIDDILEQPSRFDSMTLSLLKARFGRPGDVRVSTQLGCSFIGDSVIEDEFGFVDESFTH